MNVAFAGRLAFFAGLIWSGSVYAQDLKDYQLQGPVKSATEKSYHAEPKGSSFVKTHPGWYEDDPAMDKRYTFDEKGRILSVLFIDDAGIEEISETFTYENDLLINHFAFYEETDYAYDANGVLTEATFYGHGQETQQVYTNVNGKPVEVFSIAGDTIDHERVEYDEKGNMLRWYSVPVAGQDFHQYEAVCSYDSAGNCTIRALRTDHSYHTTEMIYDNGDLVSQIESDYIDGRPTTFVDVIFEKHLPVVKRYSEGIGDQDADELRVVETQTFSYTFDEQGNWITKTVSVNGTDHYIVERIIVYY